MLSLFGCDPIYAPEENTYEEPVRHLEDYEPLPDEVWREIQCEHAQRKVSDYCTPQNNVEEEHEEVDCKCVGTGFPNLCNRDANCKQSGTYPY